MKSLAGLLIATGIVSLLMPLFGLQLRVFAIFGDRATITAIVTVALGALILCGSVLLDKRTGDDKV